MTEYEWLVYNNQNATRNQPLNQQLIEDLAFLDSMGIRMDVFSGGQPSEGDNRTGSHRHDHGNAADVLFYDMETGRQLDWANPDDVETYQEIVRRARSNGVTGFGAGEGYMQPGSMHIGYGPEAIWGAEGSGSNAAPWLVEAWNGASGPVDSPMMAGVAPPSDVPANMPGHTGHQDHPQQGLPEDPRSPYSALTALMGPRDPEHQAYQQGLDAHGQGLFARGEDGSMNIFGRTLDDNQRQQFSRGLLSVGANLLGVA